MFSLVNIVHDVISILGEMRGWNLKTRYLLNTILCFIDIICKNYTLSYNILSFSYPAVRVIFDKYILCRSHKLAGADPMGTLDS